ncbi:MAG: hypothetical protein HYX63_13435 [Gammaproteobacteria bacterium]|nr:hypothetical protein [Gammaproteobacteria bacterium]
MTGVPTKLPSTTTADTPAVLLPYQQRWIADNANVKVCEKSRRTGLTWAEASDDTMIAASNRQAGGQNVWYIGYSLDMAKEFIDACGMWARAYQRAASEIEEDVLQDEDKQIRTFIIRFDSGFRITALSSRPSNLRGKQGVVVIDEAAFHNDLPELLKAAMALLIWGGKVRIISTHDGETNPFNELVTDCRAGKRPYSLHRLEFREAVAEGLYRRVCLRLNKPWSAAEQSAWIEEVYAFYGDAAAEELDVVPSSGEGTFLSRALIETCMNDLIPVVRWQQPARFAEQPRHIREADAGDFCTTLAPVLESLPTALRHYFGSDFARSGDVSVIWVLSEMPGLRYVTPFVIELRNIPFDQQREILHYVIRRLPRFSGGALDARGNGQYLAEATMQAFGAPRIAQVMLSQEWYREHMPPFKAAFEDRTIEIPRDADVMADLRSIKKERGIAKVPDNARYRGADGYDRHGDSAVAAALAVFALRTIKFAPIEFESTGRRESTSLVDHFAVTPRRTEVGFGTVAGGNNFAGFQ